MRVPRKALLVQEPLLHKCSVVEPLKDLEVLLGLALSLNKTIHLEAAKLKVLLVLEGMRRRDNSRRMQIHFLVVKERPKVSEEPSEEPHKGLEELHKGLVALNKISEDNNKTSEITINSRKFTLMINLKSSCHIPLQIPYLR